MKSMIYDSVRSIRQLLDSAFEMPIHFAAVGTNGAVVAGTYRAATHGRSFRCQITVQTTTQEGLTAPVNVMYVDRRGEAALAVLRLRKRSRSHSKPETINILVGSALALKSGRERYRRGKRCVHLTRSDHLGVCGRITNRVKLTGTTLRFQNRPA